MIPSKAASSLRRNRSCTCSAVGTPNFTPEASSPRRRERTSMLRFRVIAAAVVGGLIVQTVSGFRITPATPKAAVTKTPHTATSSRALAAATTTATKTPPRVQPLQPRTSISDEKRQRAYNALKRSRVERALTGVDAQMLEALTDQFFRSTGETPRARPKGRPDFVPGAMNMETMAKFRELQDVRELVGNTATNEPSFVSDQELATIAPYLLPRDGGTNPDGSNALVSKGSASERREDLSEALPVASTESVSDKKRRRISKNLPSPGQSGISNSGTPQLQQLLSDKCSSTTASSLSKRNRKVNGMDLQKYYGTDLLTADEEYALGMKIQFMMKCEQVHEGLAASLMRLPTIIEWAHACGFTDPDPFFVEAEADDQLRPAGSDSLFDETDPNMFVGNGLAQTAGPGRGRGRVKKPPPLKLKDFYDDSEYLLAKKNSANKGTVPSRKDLQPINRGTVTDFVEMLMTAREAKQRMVQSNMRLVISISRKYSNVGVSLQDLVQEGSLGLSRAAEKFDPKKGFKFSTYASWWIQQAVFRSIAYHSRTIRLPVHVHNLLNRIRKVRSVLQRELSRPPTNDEIAAQLGMTVQKYNKVLRLTKRSISLEAPKYSSNPKDLGHESDDLLGDTISATKVLEDESTPEMKVDHTLFHEDLKQMLTVLDEDELRVINARYGLSDGLTRTVTAVASQMKQSKAWVRSQECRALRKLRRPWYEKKLKEHQDALSS